MRKSRSCLRRGYRIYAAAEICVLLLIEWAMLSLPSDRADQVQFLTGLLTLLIVIWAVGAKQVLLAEKHTRLMAAALLLMVPADFFLCFLYGCGFRQAGEFTGYLLFTAAQLHFAFRIHEPAWQKQKESPESGQKVKLQIGIRFFLFALMEGIAWKIKMMTPANFFAMADLSLLLLNAVFAWNLFLEDRRQENLDLAAGLTFFTGCDYGLLAFALMPGGILQKITGLFVWVCYVPAHIFLVRSFLKTAG